MHWSPFFVAATEKGRHGFKFAVMVPLYSKLNRAKVEEQGLRSQILQLVDDQPGIHPSRITETSLEQLEAAWRRAADAEEPGPAATMDP